MQRRMLKWSHRSPTLAAIARREWLLQMLALGVAGCRSAEDRAFARGNTLIVGINGSDKDALDPDNVASTLMFLPLLRINERGEREACLATEWKHSADYIEWTYRLRPGVRWHDGTPVTVDDVKFTLDFHSRPDSPVYGTLRSECIVHDESTFTIRGTAWSDWDSVLAILPKHAVKDLDYRKWYDWDFWLRPVGNGPYRYLHYQPGTMIELEANPNYYKGKPSIERVILKFSGSGNQLTELLGGTVDAIQMDSDATQLPAVASDARFLKYWGPLRTDRRFWAIIWQSKHPLFESPDVRRALSLAIDRRELVQVLNLPSEFALVDGVYTRRQRQRGEASEPRHDLVEARRLLEQSGWRQPTSDSFREKGGQTFRFTALTSTGLGTKAAVYMQDQFRALGVRMDLQPVDRGVLRNQVRAGGFEAAVCRTIEVGNLDFLLGDRSPIGYSNPQMKKLFQALAMSAEPDVQDQLYRAMSDLLRTDQPFAFLLNTATLNVVHSRVKGLSAPWHADPLMFTEDLWLEKEH